MVVREARRTSDRVVMVGEDRQAAVAKWSRPRGARLLPRQRLWRRLDDLLEEGSVWIAGGPGAGKTALVASYVEARARPVLWYDVDRGDVDPVVCCDGLQRAALQLSGAPAGALPMLDPVQTDKVNRFLRRFLVAFYAALPPGCLVVFDNAHQALGASAFRKLLEIALRAAPADTRCLIASRTRPPAPFSRLLANGGLRLLPGDELLFSEDESITVQRLIAHSRPPRQAEQMRQIHQLAAGWPAGIRLLAEVGRLDAPSLPRAVVATQRALFDYFASEAFDRQPPQVRRVLLRLAPLPRITPAMARSIAGDDALRVLERMHADHLFTSCHGSGALIHYEFHPLLREFLRLRAQNDLSADDRYALASAAVALLVAAGELDAAADLLIAGERWDELRMLILGAAEGLVARGRQRTLSVWLDALPGEGFGDPWLTYWRGIALAPFDPPAASGHLERAYRQFDATGTGDGLYLAWTANVELICLAWANFRQLDRWLDDAERLRRCFGPPPGYLYGRFTAALFGGLAFRRAHDPSIEAVAGELLAVIEATPEVNTRILLGCNLVLYYNAVVGRHRAIEHVMRVIEPPAGSALAPVAETLLWALRSMQCWSVGAMREGAEAAARGSRLAREHGLRVWDFLLAALEAYSALDDGCLAAGQAALERARKCLDHRRQIDVAHYHYLRCVASLLARDFAQALQHAESVRAIANEFGGPHQSALNALNMASSLRGLGRLEAAWAWLRKGRRIGRAIRSDLLTFQADLFAAEWALDDGDDERAAHALRRALANGARNDYVNHHTFDPPAVARLCAWALGRGIEVDYVRRLIGRRRLAAPDVTVEVWPWPIRIYTFGRFSLVVDEGVITGAGQQKALELLQAIIGGGGRGIVVDRLADALWPDAETRGAFDVALARLRKLLRHSEAIRIEGRRVSLDERYCWVDCWAFERLLGETEQMAASTPAEPALDRAVDRLRQLYRGDFLARERDQPWNLALRERLRRRWASLLTALAQAAVERQEMAQAVRLLYEVIEVDPLAEEGYRRLMRCLSAQGEGAAVLQVYGRCRTMLATVLGVAPTSETEAIRRAILDARDDDDAAASNSA